MIKVLIITYYWPPAGGPGVQRWLKFTKYLLQYDIDPVILTVNPEDATYPIRDESLLKEVPESVEVYRTKTREFFGTYKKATSRKEVPYSGFASEKQKPGVKEKLARFVRGNFFFPDPRKAWRKYARARAEELIKEKGIDLIITTGPPHSTHLIGLDLKKKLPVQWIADFRDPWTDIYYYKDFYPTALARSIEKKMELSVLKKADVITAASPGFKAILNSKINQPEKIHVVTNGYDEDDLQDVSSVPSNQIEITYTGTLTDRYPLNTLLIALHAFPEDQQQRIKINIVGKIDRFSEELIQNSGLSVEFNLPGYVDHKSVMSYLKSSNYLLLLIPELKGNEGIIPAKLFEYIGSGSSIIGIGPASSDAAEIVNVNNFGRFFTPGDSKGLSAWLSVDIENSSSTDRDWASREKFSRKSLTSNLVDIFTGLVEKHA